MRNRQVISSRWLSQVKATGVVLYNSGASWCRSKDGCTKASRDSFRSRMLENPCLGLTDSSPDMSTDSQTSIPSRDATDSFHVNVAFGSSLWNASTPFHISCSNRYYSHFYSPVSFNVLFISQETCGSFWLMSWVRARNSHLSSGHMTSPQQHQFADEV